jgi:hypothetical protein
VQYYTEYGIPMSRAQERSDPDPSDVPLADAALRLGVTWDRAWRMMLRGQLVGHRRENGRWVVSQESVAAQLGCDHT